MRFGAVKTEEQQAASLVFRACDLLVRQQTQIINARRGHLAEFGIVAAKGSVTSPNLLDRIADTPQWLVDRLQSLDEKIAHLD